MAMRAPTQGSVYIEKDTLKFGGLNNRDASNTIEDFQASDLMNVTFDNKGEITKRNGFAAFLSAQIDTNPIESLFNYLKSNGSNYLLATSGAAIYNITSGTAVQVNMQPVANPTAAPTLATATTGGSLAAATYYVVYTWVTSKGETMVSPEASIATTGTTSTITVTIPAFPANVTSANIYISTTSGSETKQGSTATTSYTQSAALAAGTAKPASNTAGQFPVNLTSGKRFTAATYLDTLYMANGSDGIVKWDGTNYTVISGLPFSNAQYICTHKNRMYYTGDPSAPSRVWFSDLGAPETVQSLSFVDINTNDGDVITGIAEHLDSLVIFKERSIHVIRGTGPQNFIVVDSHQAHGTVSHWSIVQILNRLYYLSRTGIYSFDGNHIELESDVIRGSVLGLNNNTPWNQQYLYKACAVEYNNKYWLSLVEGTSGTTNNRTYVLDYTQKFWTRFDIPVSCFALFPVSNTFYLYSGSTTVGKVYKQDTGTSDDGATINAYLRTKDFDFGAPAHFKSFKGLFFYAREAQTQFSINITYYEDFSVQSKTVALNLGPKDSVWGSMTWGTDAWGSVLRIVSQTTSVSGQCHYLAFEVSDNSTNPWTFLGFAIRYKVKRRLK